MTRRARSLLFILSLLACGSLPLAGLLAAPAVTSTGAQPFGVGLRGDIDDLVLRNLKLAYRIDTGGTGGVDLSFLAALPNVRRLDIQDAEILVTFEASSASSSASPAP